MRMTNFETTNFENVGTNFEMNFEQRSPQGMVKARYGRVRLVWIKIITLGLSFIWAYFSTSSHSKFVRSKLPKNYDNYLLSDTWGRET